MCERGAIRMDETFGLTVQQDKCSMCLSCIDNCYTEARVLQGEDYTVSSLMEILERDESYYRTSGGGITFSGGEPLLYADFIRECAEEIHKRGWTVLIETCGYASLENLEKAAGSSDIIYCDYKHSSSFWHKIYTGKDNRLILGNIRWLDRNFKGELCLRYPYIPGCNSDPEAVETFLGFAEGLASVKDVTFLPYHRLGLDKYKGLGRKYEMGDMPSLKIRDIEFLKKYEEQYDLNISIY